MDHHGGTQSTTERRRLDERPFVSLAEALTWIAFRDAILPDHLRTHVEGHRRPIADSPEERFRRFFTGTDEDVPDVPGMGHFEDRQSGLDRLTEAWRQLRDDVDRGTVKVRGRFTSTYSLADARLARVEELTGDVLATFSQFDVSTGGIRHQPHGSPAVLWQYDPHSFDREVEAFSDDARTASGYLLVEVERVGLLGNVSGIPVARAPSVKGGYAPDDEAILAKAEEMKACGMNGRAIASAMRLERGFEHVATVHVRELIKGRWKSGGRPKLKCA